MRPQELVRGTQDGFSTKLNKVVAGMQFTEAVHAQCEPYYKTVTSSGGRPPMDPVVRFKGARSQLPERHWQRARDCRLPVAHRFCGATILRPFSC